jgi:predicted HicB family RNase H-like nuclease
MLGGDTMGKIADINTRTNITIPRDLKAQLEKIAKEQNRSLNNLIITILKDFVSNNQV